MKVMSGNTEEITNILKNVPLLNGCEVDMERLNQRLKINLSADCDEELVECQQFAKSVFEWIQLKEVIQHV